MKFTKTVNNNIVESAVKNEITLVTVAAPLTIPSTIVLSNHAKNFT